jgi:RNA polymerase sigma factor (sigma-70 family)
MVPGAGRFNWLGPTEVSAADLLRQCGEKLADRRLWEIFRKRFHRLIFVYLLRVLRHHSKRDDVQELVADLAQEVYVRLVRANGSMLRGFRGETDYSVTAFLARVCVSVVSDHFRQQEGTFRLAQNVISLEDAKDSMRRSGEDHDELNVSAVLSWIDIQRVIESDPDQKNAQRNVLIFKLFYIDGLTAQEIAANPVFKLSESGVQGVLLRLRKRISE